MILPDLPTLGLFLAATLTLNITPGPDMLYILARSVGQGRASGFVSALGLSVGYLVHTVATAFGLAALLQTSAVAFAVVKYAGAAYLLYLGIKTLLNRQAFAAPEAAPIAPRRVVFAQGILTSLFNPKVALFFVAFLPQFAHPQRGPLADQIVALGLLFCLSATVINSLAAFLSGWVGEWLRLRAGAANGLRWFTGVVFVALGLRMALLQRR